MNFYLSPEGDRYYVGIPFSYGGVNYPSVMATDDLFLSLGFTYVQVDPKPDEAFYIVTGPDNQGHWSSTPRPLNEVKAEQINIVNQQAYSLLLPSDWRVIRWIETGVSVTPAWSAYRSDTRTVAEARMAEIAAASSVDAIASMPPVEWPTPPAG